MISFIGSLKAVSVSPRAPVVSVMDAYFRMLYTVDVPASRTCAVGSDFVPDEDGVAFQVTRFYGHVRRRIHSRADRKCTKPADTPEFRFLVLELCTVMGHDVEGDHAALLRHVFGDRKPSEYREIALSACVHDLMLDIS